MNAFYRLKQFWQLLVAQPLPAGYHTTIQKHLSPAEYQLFLRFSHTDQWHSYRVMQTLRTAGHDDPALLVAALLHDVGKTKLRLFIWERVVIVLLGKLFPGRAIAWGQGEPKGWRKPFVIKEQHPLWSAEMAHAAGSDPEAIRLMRLHQSTPEPDDELLKLLQWADDQH